jgi:hypothetical protein
MKGVHLDALTIKVPCNPAGSPEKTLPSATAIKATAQREHLRLPFVARSEVGFVAQGLFRKSHLDSRTTWGRTYAARWRGSRSATSFWRGKLAATLFWRGRPVPSRISNSGFQRAYNPFSAGWRMASTAMRIAILAARANAFLVLFHGPHFEPPAALIIFRNAELRPLCDSVDRCASMPTSQGFTPRQPAAMMARSRSHPLYRVPGV